MTNQYSLPIIHPAFELLKRFARILHFLAATVIFINAWVELRAGDMDNIICYMELLIAADIYILVFFGGSGLSQRINLLFRLIETLTIFGITFTLLNDHFIIAALLHGVATLGFAFLFYREWRVMRSEAVEIKHTGISLPNFLKDEEIAWPDVKRVVPKYHSIFIETVRNKKISFELRKNLQIEDLEQIEEYCGLHLQG